MSVDMHGLLGKYFSGHATEEEAETIKKWIELDKQNQNEFSLLESLWHTWEEGNPVKFDTAKAWQKVNARIKKKESLPELIHLFASKKALAAAASIVLALCIWWMVSDKNEMHTIIAQTDTKEVLLEDGTKVYLRKGARLQYPEKFAKDSRKVSLTGEGFFEVTPNAAKQFVITADHSEVRVVGTSFSINSESNQVEVIVKTGKVQFNSRLDTTLKVQLVGGEKALLANKKIVKQLNTDDNFNAWQSHRLVFDQTPLKQVAATLSTHYNVTISLKNKDSVTLSKANITVSFTNQPLASVLKELEFVTSYPIQKINETHYEISIK